MISAIKKKPANLQVLPYMPPNLVNFGRETAESSCRDFAQPPTFFHWETLPALPHGCYNRQQADFGTCYVVARTYSLQQQNVGRAHTELCHASS